MREGLNLPDVPLAPPAAPIHGAVRLAMEDCKNKVALIRSLESAGEHHAAAQEREALFRETLGWIAKHRNVGWLQSALAVEALKADYPDGEGPEV